MSVVTSIVIIFPYSESELERVNEINNYSFKNQKYRFHWIDDEKSTHGCYSGNKKFNSVVLLASYNSFPIEDFLKFVSTKVRWDDSEYVQILINSEETNDRTFTIYKNAGAIRIVESLKW